MPHISGSDVAGVVIASAAPDVATGRRVMLQPGISCGRCAACLSGKQDVAAEIRRLTNRRGVDVVIEHVGERTWPGSIGSLARGGRLVTCGATTGWNGNIDLRVLFSKQLSIYGSYMGTKGELLRAARFFFAGQLTPVVDVTYPLAEAASAQQRLEASGQFGKIVLEV
jgi:NADPH:quinone reductase-like Zn-dependent oxidoreductase